MILDQSTNQIFSTVKNPAFEKFIFYTSKRVEGIYLQCNKIDEDKFPT